MDNNQEDHHEQEELTTIVTVPTEAEAAPIVAALKEAGISATMTGGFTAGFIAEAPGDISIKVFESDLMRGREVIRQFEIDNETIDWTKVDVGEPEDK